MADVCGREELKADFLHGFGRFTIDQRILAFDTIVRNNWAFEIGEMESTLRPVHEGPQIQVHSRTVVVLVRHDASWKVSRVLGLLD
jgi:hypothetical protein